MKSSSKRTDSRTDRGADQRKPASGKAGLANQVAAPVRSAPHRIRIIGGQWKRTPIAVVENLQLRPTPDRVRETLFNWIGPSVVGCQALDLFAGTGALGFEAASRGARQVSVVERDARVMLAIRALKERLSADMIELLSSDAQSAIEQLRRQNRRFELIFLDPPFRQDWIPKITAGLGPVLADSARIYMESEQPVSIAEVQQWLPSHVVTGVKNDQAGQVYYHLFTIESAASADSTLDS